MQGFNLLTRYINAGGELYYNGKKVDYVYTETYIPHKEKGAEKYGEVMIGLAGQTPTVKIYELVSAPVGKTITQAFNLRKENKAVMVVSRGQIYTDFVEWIEYCLQDKMKAQRLENIKSMIDKVVELFLTERMLVLAKQDLAMLKQLYAILEPAVLKYVYLRNVNFLNQYTMNKEQLTADEFFAKVCEGLKNKGYTSTPDRGTVDEDYNQGKTVDESVKLFADEWGAPAPAEGEQREAGGGDEAKAGGGASEENNNNGTGASGENQGGGENQGAGNDGPGNDNTGD